MSSGALQHRRWRKIRAYAIASWGPGVACWICQHPILSGEPEPDHVLSRALGGSPYDLANLRPAHGRYSPCYECSDTGKLCNQARGAGLPKARSSSTKAKGKALLRRRRAAQAETYSDDSYTSLDW